MNIRTPILLGAVLMALIFLTGVSEAQTMKNNELSLRQQSIIPIAAFTARGNMEQLKKALTDGLDAGLTVSEIKEVLIQMYAYTGFPRSLNGINAFMEVMEERGKKGIKDNPGKEPGPMPAGKNSIELGTDIQTRLVGKPVTGAIYTFTPAIDQFLKGHLFGDIFGRDNLDFQMREITTISALSSMEGLTAQLQAHFGIGLNIGLTEAQLKHLITVLGEKVGLKEAGDARAVLNKALGREDAKGPSASSAPGGSVIFPRGERIPEPYSKSFVGTAYLSMLVTGGNEFNCPIGNVTFEPEARNNWHKHPGGQILLVTGGRGYYQEEGKPARELREGDVVKIPPNVKHWHGAARDSRLVHLSIETNAGKGPATWLEPVSDEDYNQLK